MISSVLNPAFYEADFRPIIAVTLIILFLDIFLVIKYWSYFKNYIFSDWE